MGVHPVPYPDPGRPLLFLISESYCYLQSAGLRTLPLVLCV